MNARTFTIARYGHTFTIAADDELMESHYRNGELCEPHMLDWIERNIPRGGVWVDAGANIGNHALPFALWADRVVAFEPMPVNFDLLAMNIANFPHGFKVEAWMCGVSDHAATCSAKLGGTGKNCQWEMQADEPGEIIITTIDTLVDERADVRLIKLDVEGMEPAAIRGAMETIKRCKPELFIEIWDEAVLAEIGQMLAPLGYVLTERYNEAPTFHFSASGRYPVTYTPAERLRP
jgi:FkbM family methyltransferase